MNLKKILARLTTIMILGVLVLLQGATYAATVQTGDEISLGAMELMSTDPNMGYAIEGNKIWNIVKYSSTTADTYNQNSNIYCLKANKGLGQVVNGSLVRRATYDTYFDMKTERTEIAKLTSETDTTLKDLVEGTITDSEGITVSKYNAILAIIDNLYLPGNDTKKAELMESIIDYAKTSPEYTSYVPLMQMEEYQLTDSDIKAVQQAALWYFTNNEDSVFDKVGKIGWLQYTTDGNTYDSLSNYNPDSSNPSKGEIRSYEAEILYNYIISQAKENASKYENSSSNVGAPANINTTTLSYEESGSNYIVGPINITENANAGAYTIDFKVKNGETEITDYQLLDQDKNAVSTGTTVKDLVGNNFYISVPKSEATSLAVNIKINYSNTTMTLWTSSTNYQNQQPVVIIDSQPDSVEKTLTLSASKSFDLSLRKYITKVNGVELTDANSRVPNIDESSLTSGTTATYKHKKDPVTIASGYTVTYKITIYNEGETTGRATKVVDQLPTGLQFTGVISGNFELGNYDETNNTVNLVRKSGNTDNLAAYTTGSLAQETIEIECKVTATADSSETKILTNVAWIAEEIDEEGTTITTEEGKDRDSEPGTVPSVNKDNMSNYTGNGNKEDLTDSNYYYKGQQDDDDFEKLVLLPEGFDLKLIKRITAVNNQNVPERIESVDVSKLNTLDANGKMITTADYQLNKNYVTVEKGDIVTYTFRIYNEGTIDGYAQEITEDVPEGLEFLWSEKEGEELQADTTLTDEEKEAIEFNQKYLWGNFVYDDARENIIKISSDYLSKENETTPGGNLISAFGRNDGTKTEDDISYKEIAVKFKVVSDNTTGNVIRNEAAITEDCDEDGNPVDDRDSKTDEWVKYEDDEDYDNIILQSFDLALRKFIVAVSDDTEIENDEYLKNEDGSYKRAPVVDTSKLNTLDENGKLITTATYNHTKEPVLVKQNDIVVYMLRAYNEGEMNGYAAEIKDHLPSYLEFVEGEFNTQYGWEVSEDGRTVTTKYLENSLISKAQTDESGNIVLSYKEVPIMCKVKDTAKTNENITNIADITKYLNENKETVRDRDSQENNVELPSDDQLPGYKGDETGSYVPGQQDDDDFEKVIVKNFDLALRKWVTEAIVIENGQQSITQTGHQPYDDPEQVVKVELNRKKLSQVTVKFKYSIRVINEGDIAGYAKEVTDYVPEGLKFMAEDNPGWTDEGNNVISTRLLENTLLQPGEYADIEVILTWINNEDNMGLKTNVAEISEDYNEYGVPDKDSTPDNKKDGEDDIDDAPVMLSVSTGQVRIYFTLGFIVLITIASGVILIKKFVL